MKDKLFKKRNHVDWYALRLQLSDMRVDEYFFTHFRKGMSVNRQSYYALLYVYGKKCLDRYRYTGVLVQ